MGLEIDYFYSLTPRQFNNIQKGWQERRDAEMKLQMLLTRKVMYTNLLPYSKNLTEQDLLPMDVDEAVIDEVDVDDIKASIARWEARDAARQKNKSEN